MKELGTEPSVVGVARLYARWVSTLVIDEADRADVEAVEAQGMRCIVAPTIMDSPKRAAALARVVIAGNG
jgi:LPPG:FO 2-phospho-L-lactate transferase